MTRHWPESLAYVRRAVGKTSAPLHSYFALVGNVAIKNVSDLYLYPNTVRAVAITGAQVKDWLERSAGIFNQLEPGKADQPLINSEFPPTISTSWTASPIRST